MAKKRAGKTEKLDAKRSAIFRGFKWCNYFANPTPTASDPSV